MNLSITPEFMPRVRWHEPMSLHTSWRAGGPADMFFLPRDIEDLAAFLRALPVTVPVFWVGLGSNLLVRDGGIRGVVIGTAGAFTRIERRSQSRIHCQASVPCARIARACVSWGLAQAEFFAGIPGTFGGALAMNAGAFGDETWRHVLRVETINRHGERHTRGLGEFHVGYRQVEPVDPALRAGAQEWFLSADLQFDKPQGEGGDAVRTGQWRREEWHTGQFKTDELRLDEQRSPELRGAEQPGAAERGASEPRTAELRNNMRVLNERRKQTQPLGEWSCGSVFRNPPGDHAARLIEAAGLKGHRIGDAVVSEKHANFIINDGQASGAELERLIRHVQRTVKQQFGIALQTEVRIVGERGPNAASDGGEDPDDDYGEAR